MSGQPENIWKPLAAKQALCSIKMDDDPIILSCVNVGIDGLTLNELLQEKPLISIAHKKTMEFD